MLLPFTTAPVAGPGARPSGRPSGSSPALAQPCASAVTGMAAVLAGHAAFAPAGSALVWALAAGAAVAGASGVLPTLFGEDPAARRRGVALFTVLALAGIAAGFAGGVRPGGLAAAALFAAFAFHAGAGHRAWIGPLLPGAHFAALLLAGVPAETALPGIAWLAAAGPLLFGIALGVIGRGPAWRGDRRPALLALALLLVALALPVGLGWRDDASALAALPFTALLTWRVLPDVLWAASDPRPGPVRAAVTAAGHAVILLDAAIAAGFAGTLAGLMVLALEPAAGLLERTLGPR